MIRRIHLKAVYFTNSAFGFLFSLSERIGILRKIPFELYRKIPGTMKVDLPLPFNFDQKDKEHFNHNSGYNTYDLSIYKLSNVNVSIDGIVFKDVCALIRFLVVQQLLPLVSGRIAEIFDVEG
jgi:hypothetical protein